MSNPENMVKMTAKLYESRTIAKRLLGDKYQDYMATYQRGIKAMMELKNLNEIQAAIELTKICQDTTEPLFVLAAAVEMVEPSKPVAGGEQVAA